MDVFSQVWNNPSVYRQTDRHRDISLINDLANEAAPAHTDRMKTDAKTSINTSIMFAHPLGGFTCVKNKYY